MLNCGLIARGIRYGRISGEEDELRKFIIENIANPADIAVINQLDGRHQTHTVIAELFGFLPSAIKKKDIKNILFAFRIFFEKNPLSLIKSTQQKKLMNLVVDLVVH